MGTWRGYIESLENEFIGKKVIYDGRIFSIVKVDYNGMIHINKPGKHTTTSAVFNPSEARKAII